MVSNVTKKMLVRFSKLYSTLSSHQANFSLFYLSRLPMWPFRRCCQWLLIGFRSPSPYIRRSCVKINMVIDQHWAFDQSILKDFLLHVQSSLSLFPVSKKHCIYLMWLASGKYLHRKSLGSPCVFGADIIAFLGGTSASYVHNEPNFLWILKSQIEKQNSQHFQRFVGLEIRTTSRT